jgi:hypothetical protein
MTGKELMKHLHMGCGEPLTTALNQQQVNKKDLNKNQDKPTGRKTLKDFPVN